MLLLGACSKTNTVDQSTTNVGDSIGDECETSDDCLAAVCVYGRCRTACSSDADCGDDEHTTCYGNGDEAGCSLPFELVAANGSCEPPLQPGPDNLCREPCTSDGDCPRANQVCKQEACFDAADPQLCVTGTLCCVPETTSAADPIDASGCDDGTSSGPNIAVCDLRGFGWRRGNVASKIDCGSAAACQAAISSLDPDTDEIECGGE